MAFLLPLSRGGSTKDFHVFIILFKGGTVDMGLNTFPLAAACGVYTGALPTSISLLKRSEYDTTTVQILLSTEADSLHPNERNDFFHSGAGDIL